MSGQGFLDEEVGHLLEGLFVEGHRAMLAVRYADERLKASSLLQHLGEAGALTVGNDVVGLAVEDEEAWALGSDVCNGADERHEVGIIGRSAADECRLGRTSVLHRLAVLHVRHIDRPKPIDDSIYGAREVKVAAHGAFEVNGGGPHGARLHLVSNTGERCEMSTAGEACDAHEGGVELIFIGIGTDETQRCFHVVDLCRKLGIAARTVVDAHDSKTGIHQGLADRHESHRLHVVGVPRAAVDGYDDGVFILAGIGQVDVEAMGFKVVAGVIEVLKRSAVLGHLKALRLCRCCHGKAEKKCE